MKVHVEIDGELTEPEVVIKAPTAAIADQLQATLTAVQAPLTITLSQRGSHYQVNLAEVLFFEVADHQVTVHTASEMYSTRRPLTELASDLPANFQRVFKSAILNRDQVLSLTKSVTGNLVHFQKSHKQLYVSRRFYKALQIALERKG